MAYVYILKSINYPKTYIGSTIDLERRMNEHNTGASTFSKRYKPWKIVYQEKYKDITTARRREKYLKSAAGRKFIQRNNIIPR
ncbi:GIY-YIG nuclease family protein [Patescibacteria group bacterium]|nr:GIY-YIG nuclease family protein [Patescibacteria group bacterium]